MSRRGFIDIAARAALGLAVASGGYTVLEAKWLRVTAETIPVPRLPAAFDGLRVVVLGDIHHGPFVPRPYVRAALALARDAGADLIALVGDYVHRSASFIEPVFEDLARLRAPLGVFAVRGNHDNWESGGQTSAAMRAAGIHEISNEGTWLERGRARLRIGGLADLWSGSPNVAAAVGDTGPGETAIVLSHNPDVAETCRDGRVGLFLSGHTHGGQVVVPGYGAPMLPSKYGQKYAHGLCRGPVNQVFVTRGVGTVTPPVRFLCRPEVAVLTLVPRGAA